MAHRTFKDKHGIAWDAWTVVPTKVERRLAGSPVLTEPERRKKNAYRGLLGPVLVNGWLCFESKTEKRRLAPFPPDWHNLYDEALAELCESAELAPSRPRRLIE